MIPDEAEKRTVTATVQLTKMLYSQNHKNIILECTNNKVCTNINTNYLHVYL